MGQAAKEIMKILIIGGTGFISSSIADKLLKRGHSVTLFTRGKKQSDLNKGKNVNLFSGDRDKISDLKKISEENFDVVYDMIAYTPSQSETAAKIFSGKTGRFIHCSTISVYMVSNEITLPVTEDQYDKPLMEYDPRNPFGMQYGIDKRECEKVLWSFHDEKLFPVTMVRPTFVSGPRDPAKRDYFWIQRIMDGGPLLIPGRGEFKFQQIYVDDCAEIFCKILDNDISIGQAYNAAAEEAFTLNEYLTNLSRLLNKNPEFVHMNQVDFDNLGISYSNRGDVFPFNTRKDVVFSLEKVKEELDYKSTPFDEWMQLTIDWFIDVYKKPSTGYDLRDEELKIIKSL
jgi:nucleoside-diphosphate-sugar epimerase